MRPTFVEGRCIPSERSGCPRLLARHRWRWHRAYARIVSSRLTSINTLLLRLTAAASMKSPSLIQEYILRRIERRCCFPHHVLALRLQGDWDPEIISSAIIDLVTRHEILNTRFPTDPETGRRTASLSDTPAGLIGPSPAAWEGKEPDMLIDSFAAQPLDIEAASGFRAGAFRIGPAGYFVTLVLHSLIADASSRLIVFRDMFALLQTAESSPRQSAARRPLQHSDFAAADRRSLHAQDTLRVARLVAERLQRTPSFKHRERRPLADSSSPHSSIHHMIPTALIDGIRSFGARHAITPNVITLVAFSICLSAWAGITGLCTPVDLRSNPQWRSSVGPMADSAVLPLHVKPGMDFAQVLQSLAATELSPQQRAASRVSVLNSIMAGLEDFMPRVIFTSRLTDRSNADGEAIAPGIESRERSISLYLMKEVFPAPTTGMSLPYDLSVLVEYVAGAWRVRADFDCRAFAVNEINDAMRQYISILATVVSGKH